MSGRRALTAAQRGIWFAERLGADPAAFVTADCVRLPAEADAERLARSVARTLREVPALHARLGEHDGRPFQWLPSDPVVDVPVIDLDGEAEADRWMDADRRRPFDLAAGPLCRQAVLRVAAAGVWWYQAIHHVATDAYGTGLLMRRAAEHYADPVAALPPRFADLGALLAYEEAYGGSPAAVADREHWRAVLAGFPGATAVGRRPPGHGMATPRRAATRLDAPPPAPPLTVALVATWLHRITGDRDIVIGLHAMGRLGSPAARVPTCWVNVVPVRLQLAPGTTVAAADEAATAALGAVSRHGRHRYEDLRRDLGRLGEGRRLIGPVLNIKPFARELRFGPHRAIVHHLAAGPVDDMVITIEGERLTVEGHPDAYSPHEIAGHARRLACALGRGARMAPDDPLERLDILTADDRRRALRHARGRRVAVPDGTLWSGFAESARRTPAAIAVVADGREHTYADVRARAEGFAAVLASRGAAPGRVVGVSMDRSADLFVALLAVLRTGAAYLPLEPDQPRARLEAMREDADPVCVVDAVEEGDHATPPVAGPQPHDIAYLLYTSGSTGRPKGVEVSHRAIVNRLAWIGPMLGFTARERVMLKTPLGFDVSVWELFWALHAGAIVVVAPAGVHRDPAALAQVMARERVSVAHFVPSMLKAFLAEPDVERLRTLRHVVCSGEALGAEVARRCRRLLPAAALHNLYGPTEAAVDVTAWRVGDDLSRGVPIGRPVWNTDAHVLDPAGHPSAPGAVGELHLAGVQLARGYRGRPDLTAERFVPDPFGAPGERVYRTGDLVRRRDDGVLEYHGRVDGQVKVRGVRVELGEVEAAIAAHPAVAQAAAAVRVDGDEARLVGYAVPAAGAELDPQAVRRHVADLLPAAMVPAAVVELRSLPVGATGKLDRAALPDPPPPDVGRAPRSPLEERMCDLFARVLGAPRVGADDSFFDAGGSSLAAARLTALLRSEFGAELSIGDVFASPTPAGLVARIAAGDADATAPMLTLRQGDGPPLFCVHPAGGLGWCYGLLAARLPVGRPVVALQADDRDDADMEALARRYVDRVRERWPTGPYHLLGWSVGGVIAHAMATRLESDGEWVGMVALLDAYPGDAWRHLAPPTERDALAALLVMGGLNAGEGDLTVAGVRERLEQEGSALAALSEGDLARVARTVVRTAGLMRRAQHAPFGGDVAFFTATAPRAEDWLDRRSWEPHVRGRILNQDVGCTHPELVRDPAASAIARRVGELMEETEGAPARLRGSLDASRRRAR